MLTWLTSENQSLRQLAYKVWPKLRQKLELPDITELLLAALQDEDSWVWRPAAIVLGQLRNVEAITHAKREIQLFARRGLWLFYLSSNRETLVQALSHEAWQVRTVAVNVLGKQTDVWSWLEQALYDNHENVRAAAVNVLGKQTNVWPWLEQALYDSHKDVRTAAVNVLGKQINVWPWLEWALYDSHENVHSVMVNVLGKQTDIWPWLEQVLQT